MKLLVTLVQITCTSGSSSSWGTWSLLCRGLLFLLASLVPVILSGCDPALRIRMHSLGPPPTFLIVGPFGAEHPVRAVEVWGWPSHGQRAVGSGKLQWRIVAESARSADLTSVTYGVVPDGFAQVFPQYGPPPALDPAWMYSISAVPGGGFATAPGLANFAVGGEGEAVP